MRRCSPRRRDGKRVYAHVDGVVLLMDGVARSRTTLIASDVLGTETMSDNWPTQ